MSSSDSPMAGAPSMWVFSGLSVVRWGCDGRGDLAQKSPQSDPSQLSAIGNGRYPTSKRLSKVANGNQVANDQVQRRGTGELDVPETNHAPPSALAPASALWRSQSS